MQTNENGDIALKYFQTIRKLVRMGDGTEYVFVPQANICMAWIHFQHVNQILSMKSDHCNCGGSLKPAFFLANESDVRRWTNKGGS